jgi:hypothetical protein
MEESMNEQTKTDFQITRTELEENEERLACNEARLAQIGVDHFADMSREEQKQDLIRRALPGKCPMRFIEGNYEQLQWESALLKDPYKSCEEVLMELTGTTDYTISTGIFTSGLGALTGNNVGRKANMAIQALADAAPQDATEAKLCMQEMALYEQGMKYLKSAEGCDMLIHKEFYLKSAMKLLRLHNETIEARNKYRRGGEQRVVVQHVNVTDGAQAIVNNGNMVAGGGRK